MKNILTILFCFFLLYAKAQPKLNRFHVVDMESKRAIPSVSVIIIRAKLSITTQDDGVFIIPGNLKSLRDTVVVYARNYSQFKSPLNKLYGADTIRLSRLHTDAYSAPVLYHGDTVLNNYEKNDISHYAGMNSESARFDYLQLAQKFYINKKNTSLRNVTVNRMRDFMPTRFRIRIYAMDATNGGPGQDLCKEIIETVDLERSEYVFDLKKYNIIIPDKIFFVAVEWMRDYYNRSRSPVYNKKTGKIDTLEVYRPFVGIAPTTAKKLNIWGLSFKMEWKPYDYFSPFGTDLAMKAIVAY